jgi:hypothetical protein
MGNQKTTKDVTAEELIEVLKFTPRTYRVELGNYGGEVYCGRVDRKVYDYFKKNNIDLDEYNGDWDNELNIPEDMQPFPPGSPYECDDLIHASGATMDDGNYITVYDENGDEVWQHSLDLNALDDSEIPVDEWESFNINEIADGNVIFWGAQGEKGLLYGGNIELKEPFDPKKLELKFANADGWYICNHVMYDGEDIDNDDMSTTGKWGENKFIIGGDEPVYDPADAIEPGKENGGAGWPSSSYWPEDSEVVEFKFKKHKPTHVGWYSCRWGYGNTSGKLYWNGTEFVDFEYNKEQSIDQKGIVEWSGLNWDTSDWANCPQPKEVEDEDRVKDLEDALEELKAEFEALCADDADELKLINCACKGCAWEGPIDDTLNNEHDEMVCPECKSRVDIISEEDEAAADSTKWPF